MSVEKEPGLTKYRNKFVHSEYGRFDSILEYKVFLAINDLLKKIDSSQIRLERQYKVSIKPKTLKFAAIAWKADFVLIHQSRGIILLIEAKGKLTNEFMLKLKMLEFLDSSSFGKVIFIFSNFKDAVNNGLKLKCPTGYIHPNNVFDSRTKGLIVQQCMAKFTLEQERT